MATYGYCSTGGSSSPSCGFIPVVQSELCISISSPPVRYTIVLLWPGFFSYGFLGCWLGRLTLSFNQSLMLASGLSILRGIAVRVSRSSKDSLLSEDLFSLFITFSVEKLLSSFPLVTGREKRSWASTKGLWHSPALGHETTSTRLSGNRVLPGKWNWWHIAASQETLFGVDWRLPQQLLGVLQTSCPTFPKAQAHSCQQCLLTGMLPPCRISSASHELTKWRWLL